MDGQQFDEMIRRIASHSVTRRAGWRWVPAAIGGVLGLSAIEAAAKQKDSKKKGKSECRGDKDCDRKYLPGLNCDKGRCVCKRGGNCTGCCLSEKKCVLKENQNFTACGLGGIRCEECNDGVGCDRDTGTCVCSPFNTCAGCCYDGGKRCHPTGVDNKRCGKHIVCVDCTKTGRVCQSNGTCCVAVGGTCDSNDPNRRCCAEAGVSCLDNTCTRHN